MKWGGGGLNDILQNVGSMLERGIQPNDIFNLIWPKVGLIFHQNVLFNILNILYQFSP